MKRLLFILLLLPVFVEGQIITTVAGNGLQGNTGNGGPATAAEIAVPGCSTFDKQGKLYIQLGSGNRIRVISPAGIINLVAGTGTAGYNGDGIPATSAQLNNAQNAAVDSIGNVYIADLNNNRVRKVDAITGIISTVAGNGTAGYAGDNGPATAAMINTPIGICFDKIGNLFIAEDGNVVIRKVNTSGVITTFAGTGVDGYNGDNIPATSAQLGNPTSVCTDNASNLYIGDISGRIRKVNTSGIITSIAGTGHPGVSGDGGPATNAQVVAEAIAIDKFGNLYTAEGAENVVREINSLGIINTIAGTGVAGFSPAGGLADTTKINYAWGVAIDTCGNVYYGDQYNYRVCKITYPYCGYLNVSEAITKIDLTIFPNPATTSLTVTSPQNITNITITNLIGQTVYTQNYNSPQVQIDIANLPTGIYFVKVNNTEVRKFVKE